MGAVSAEDCRRLLETLDTAALTRFVADLWERRGYDVTVGDGVVRARDTATGASERIAVARRTLTGWKIDCDAADTVVATRETDAARRLADDRSAAFVGPETVRNLLLYAVDPADRRSLFETHFDRAPADSPRDSLRGRFGGVADRAELFVIVVVLAAVVAGVSVHGDVADGGAPELDTRKSGQAVATETPSAARRGEIVFPPGIDEEGVVDASRLAVAHADSLESVSYRMVVIRRRSSDGGGRREGYRRIRVNDTMRYRTESGGNLSVSEGEFGSMPSEVYADGSVVYRRVRGTNGTVYLTGPTMRAGRFSNQAEWYLSRYLATDGGDVSRATVPGGTRYVVAATGTPTYLTGNVTNYTAVAVVESGGFVRSLNVSYTLTVGETTQRVEFVLVYRERGDVEVTPPSWYAEARNATGVRTDA